MPPTPPKKKKPFIKRQKMMDKVLIALAPAMLGAIYFFGWRSLALVAFVTGIAIVAEWVMARQRKDQVSEAAIVTGVLLGLSLPPTLPFWMAGVGAVVGIIFGKEVFGGYGRNVFNPAIVGRGFLFVCFPGPMTGQFASVWNGITGGFLHWGPRTQIDGIDCISAATPMWANRDLGFTTSLVDLFTGKIGQTFSVDGVERALTAGAMGEVSALLLIIGGAYLLWTKTANWRLTTSTLIGAVVASGFFRYVLGSETVPTIPFTLLSGAMLYAAIFMVTDPISAPRDKKAQYIYGAFIGIMIVFLRWQAVFSGAVAFAILLGNTIAPTVDQLAKDATARKKKKIAAATAAAKGASA